MRFKVDENLPAEVAEALRALGHDADTVEEEGLGESLPGAKGDRRCAVKLGIASCSRLKSKGDCK